MSSSVQGQGTCQLNIIDHRIKDPYENKQCIKVTGSEQLTHAIWERFNVNQNGDRELIQQALSSPKSYDVLSFSTDQYEKILYQIITGISNRDTLFPRKPVTLQDGSGSHRAVRFTGFDYSKHKLERFDYDTANFNAISESLPEVVALYQAETFLIHSQRVNESDKLWRSFAKIT